MKKLIALFVLLGVVLAAPAYGADEKQEGSMWERLRRKIELLTPKKKTLSLSFQRVDEDTIKVTVTNGKRSFDFDVTKIGSVKSS